MVSVIKLNDVVYQTQTDYDLSNFLRTYKTNLHLNRNVRPTLKCLGARLKKCKNAKKVWGLVPKKKALAIVMKYEFH